MNIFGNINGNNNKNINNDINMSMNINGNNQIIGKNNKENKGIKKKRGPKKEKKINIENKGREYPSVDVNSQISGNKGKRSKKNSIMGNGLSRNIFSVRNNKNGIGNDLKNKKNGIDEEIVEII